MNYCHFFPQSFNRKGKTAEGQMEILTNSSIFLHNSYLFLQAFIAVGLFSQFSLPSIWVVGNLVWCLYLTIVMKNSIYPVDNITAEMLLSSYKEPIWTICFCPLDLKEYEWTVSFWMCYGPICRVSFLQEKDFCTSLINQVLSVAVSREKCGVQAGIVSY